MKQGLGWKEEERLSGCNMKYGEEMKWNKTLQLPVFVSLWLLSKASETCKCSSSISVSMQRNHSLIYNRLANGEICFSLIGFTATLLTEEWAPRRLFISWIFNHVRFTVQNWLADLQDPWEIKQNEKRRASILYVAYFSLVLWWWQD